MNRIYHAAMVAAKDPGLKGALFRRAMEVKMDRFKMTGEVTHMFWDKLVFRKVCTSLSHKQPKTSNGVFRFKLFLVGTSC